MLMINPIEGPDPPDPTPCDVERWLVAAFLTLSSTPVYSARFGSLRAVSAHVAPATFDWVAFSGEILGPGCKYRLALLTWARVRADELRHHPGGTVADFCEAHGIDKREFRRRKAIGALKIARAWAARGAVALASAG